MRMREFQRDVLERVDSETIDRHLLSLFSCPCVVLFSQLRRSMFSVVLAVPAISVCVCVCVFYRGTLLSKVIREHLPNHAPRDLSPLEDETQSNYEVIFHVFSNPRERAPHDRTAH